MSFDLFKKIVDECAELGITHVRMHNYGEAFLDRPAAIIVFVILGRHAVRHLHWRTPRARPVASLPDTGRRCRVITGVDRFRLVTNTTLAAGTREFYRRQIRA